MKRIAIESVSAGRFVAGLTLAVLVSCLSVATAARAQEALSVSITPPLVQLTIGPGESWASTLKVVNNNAYDVSYYAHVVDFTAAGEDGSASFQPVVDQATDPGAHSFSLGSWIHVSSAPLFIPKGSTAELPFSVQVPPNAEPGGHYAAILIGTNPGAARTDGPTMKISSFVSSLIFVKIKGDVTESGRIREFHAEKALYDSADATFLVRFENTGNTHVRPQGDITLYNMWGKERGQVQVNQNGNFGNVLPSSTRRFTFSWAGENDLFDLGRYSAVVTLTYGDDAKHNITATTYFWVVPTKPAAITLGVLALFLALMTWFIRRYIRRALLLERERLGIIPHTAALPSSTVTPTIAVLLEPLREGAVDLRRITQTVPNSLAPSSQQFPQENTSENIRTVAQPLTFGRFLKKYRVFFLFIIVVAVALFGGTWYFSHVLVQKRAFQISHVTAQQEEGTSKPAQR